KRTLVEGAGAVDDEGAMRSEFRQCGGDGVDYIRRKHAQYLRFGARRIRERAKKIKDGAVPDLLARGRGVAGRGVGGGSKQKTEANLTHGAAGGGERRIDAHAQGFQNIRGAAAGTDRTVAVLGNAGARRGRNNR